MSPPLDAGQQFFSMFAQANTAVWPMQVVWYITAIAAVVLALRHVRASDPLIAAFDRIAKADDSITKLAHFEARYRTRGDFEIIEILGGRAHALRSIPGPISWASRASAARGSKPASGTLPSRI